MISGGKVFVASTDSHTVHAFSADDGKKLWQFIAGGRIDSSPTVFNGMVLFGSADGWVYALQEDAGELIWKFRAAPSDEMVGAYGQMESRWPVHGSVLVQQDTLYVTAGRSSYHDGGIVFYQLDPWTGEQRSRELLYHLDPKTGRELNTEKRGSFNMVGTSSDILSGDGTNFYMKQLAFDEKCKPTETTTPHLYSVTGLLGEEWFVRAYWRFGARHGAGWSRWAQAANQSPFGRILSFDGKRIYGFGRVEVVGGAIGHRKDAYHLFASPKPGPVAAAPPAPKKGVRGKKKPANKPVARLWSGTCGLTVRAQVLAGDQLLIAGPTDVAKKSDSKALSYENEAETLAAMRGEKGAFLNVHSTKEGARKSQVEILSVPVFDGMSVAGDRVFVSLLDGSIICLQ